MTAASRPRVVIVWRYVTHYRLPFLELLRERLAGSGIDLEVVHGFPSGGPGGSKQDTVTVPWATHMDTRAIDLGGTRLLWEPALGAVRGADLVIVEQASTRLLNYVLFAGQLLGRTRMAFWGHGRNFKQAQASAVGEAAKRSMSRRVHWWFAYTERTVRIVEDLGFPPERITDVQNAIDTRGLTEAHEQLTPDDLRRVRVQLDLPDGPVVAFVGGMYPERRLGFLVEAVAHARTRLPELTLLLMGSGPDADVARAAAGRHPWVRYLGPKLGTDKVPYLALAELLLLPGPVGLAVLDAFALELPLVTVADAPHGPEIAYLEAGRNGVVAPAGSTPADYGALVADLLTDPRRLAELRAGCRGARERYTVEEMARRFAEGVEQALRAG